MTKNIFLSKRLACLLTTSLITLFSIQNPLSAATTSITTTNVSVTDDGLPNTTDIYNFGNAASGELRIGDGTGDPAQTINARITNTTAGEGTLSILNDENIVTFNSTLFDTLETITLATGSAVIFNTAVGAGSFNINGSAIAFFGADDNVATILTTGNTSEILLGRDITDGLTAFISDEQNITAGTRIYMPVTMTNGQTIKLFTGTITDGTNAAGSLTKTRAALQDTSLFTYTAANNAGATEQTITATARTSSGVESTLGINNNKASAFIQAHAAALANESNDDGAITAFEDLFTQAFDTTKTEDTKLAKQVSPQTDVIAGSTIAAKAVTSGVQNVISTRLASLRSGDAYSTGIVTGSHMGANSGFIQAFGSTVEQKNKGNEFGYDADTTGFAIGFDTKIPGGAVIGISYARSEADVDGKGTGRAKNDIKTDSVSLYADYATKDGYVEGSITYGKSDNKGSRIVNSADLDRTYKSNYDGEQYSFRLSGGIPQSLGGGAFITPFAAATISQIKADAYTETSTTADDTFRLRVAQDTVDSQVGTVGVKFHQAIKDGKTTFTPEVKLAVNQEFGDGNITTTNTYQGGGTSFKNSTAIERTSATAGLGLNISSDNVSFNIGYEADVRDKYLGHSAQAKITAKF